MTRKPKITNLRELEKRKKELRLESTLIRRELAHSMGTSRENFSTFLLKRVAIPVGGTGLALFVLNKILSAKRRHSREVIRETKIVHEYPEGYSEPIKKPERSEVPETTRPRGPGMRNVIKLGRIVIPIVQAIIGAVNSHRAAQRTAAAKEANN